MLAPAAVTSKVIASSDGQDSSPLSDRRFSGRKAEAGSPAVFASSTTVVHLMYANRSIAAQRSDGEIILSSLQPKRRGPRVALDGPVLRRTSTRAHHHGLFVSSSGDGCPIASAFGFISETYKVRSSDVGARLKGKRKPAGSRHGCAAPPAVLPGQLLAAVVEEMAGIGGRPPGGDPHHVAHALIRRGIGARSAHV